MLLILIQSEILLIFNPDIILPHQINQILLNLEKLLVLIIFLIVRQDWNPITDLVPKTVDRIIK